MRRQIVLAISCVVVVWLCGCGCNGSPVVPPDNELKVVGDYTYCQMNGNVVETGMLMMDSQHRIRLVPDRSSATTVISNWWFDISCEYSGYQRLEEGLPVYYHNDDVKIDFNINYKQNIPLNQESFLYTRGWIQHRNARDMSLLPGKSVQVGKLLLEPYGNLMVRSVYRIPPGVPQEHPYTWVAPMVSIELVYRGGIVTTNLGAGMAGSYLIGVS
jgi:hypothetical protein